MKQSVQVHQNPLQKKEPVNYNTIEFTGDMNTKMMVFVFEKIFFLLFIRIYIMHYELSVSESFPIIFIHIHTHTHIHAKMYA